MKSFRIKPSDPVHVAIAVPVIAAIAVGAREIFEWVQGKMKKTSTARIAGEEYAFQNDDPNVNNE